MRTTASILKILRSFSNQRFSVDSDDVVPTLARLLLLHQQSEFIVRTMCDGALLLRGSRIVYVNAVASRLLQFSPVDQEAREARETSGAGGTLGTLEELTQSEIENQAHLGRLILDVLGKSLPVDWKLQEPGRADSYYRVEAFRVSDLDLAAASDLGPGIEKAGIQVRRWFETVHQVFAEAAPDQMILLRDVTLDYQNDHAKRQFLAALAHEVRTPLTSLTLATRMLRRRLDRDGISEYDTLINTCVSDVDRMRHLIEEFVAAARPSPLTQMGNFVSVDFIRLLSHTVQSFYRSATDRGVQIRFEKASATAITVRADASKLSWAIQNVLNDALKNSERGDEITLGVELLPSREVEVRITDLGSAPVDASAGANYDIRSSRSIEVGMGLSIAREILEAHGGRLKASHHARGGAQFVIGLPIERNNTEESGVYGAYSGR